MTEVLCRWGCGRPAIVRGSCRADYKRWHAQGFPEGGPRPPMSQAARTALATAARYENRRVVADEYDLAWFAAYQDRRVTRWAPLIAAGAHSVRCFDRHGVQVLWERAVKAGDPEALFTALLGRVAELEDALRRERATEGQAA